jgi:hypothetical protein
VLADAFVVGPHIVSMRFLQFYAANLLYICLILMKMYYMRKNIVYYIGGKFYFALFLKESMKAWLSHYAVRRKVVGSNFFQVT